MTPPPPIDHTRLWEGYGATLGAALQLELTLRLANGITGKGRLGVRNLSQLNYERALEKLGANLMKGTFGSVVERFIALHEPKLAVGQLQMLREAVRSRNTLAHYFISGFYPELFSERGLDKIAAICAVWRSTFKDLDRLAHQLVPIDMRLLRASADEASVELGGMPGLDALLDDEPAAP